MKYFIKKYFIFFINIISKILFLKYYFKNIISKIIYIDFRVDSILFEVIDPSSDLCLDPL